MSTQVSTINKSFFFCILVIKKHFQRQRSVFQTNVKHEITLTEDYNTNKAIRSDASKTPNLLPIQGSMDEEKKVMKHNHVTCASEKS